MFEQTIYTVLYAKYSEDGTSTEWKEEQLKGLSIHNNEISKVTTIDDVEFEIDNVTTFARRSTGMFDKTGNMLLGGDVVKVSIIHAKTKEVKEVLLPILWINAAYCLALDEEYNNEIVYLTQTNVMEMEKVGNIHQHGKILEKEVDESIFEQNASADNVDE